MDTPHLSENDQGKVEYSMWHFYFDIFFFLQMFIFAYTLSLYPWIACTRLLTYIFIPGRYMMQKRIWKYQQLTLLESLLGRTDVHLPQDAKCSPLVTRWDVLWIACVWEGTHYIWAFCVFDQFVHQIWKQTKKFRSLLKHARTGKTHTIFMYRTLRLVLIRWYIKSQTKKLACSNFLKYARTGKYAHTLANNIYVSNICVFWSVDTSNLKKIYLLHSPIETCTNCQRMRLAIVAVSAQRNSYPPLLRAFL